MKSLEATREELVTLLATKGVIKDAEHVGSNIGLMVDILSYVKYNIEFGQANVIKEVMLPTTTSHKNAMMIAQDVLGYVIDRPNSSEVTVNIKSKDVLGDKVVTLPSGSKFKSELGTSWYTQQTYTIREVPTAVKLFEGVLIDKEVDVDHSIFKITKPTSMITIPYNSIAKGSILVTKNGVALKRVDKALDLKEGKYIEVNDVTTNWVNIQFSFVGHGQLLQSGDTIEVKFVVTKGAAGNGASEFSYKGELLKDVDGTDRAIIVDKAASASSNGSDIESLESIKENAPRRYNTGVVTVSKSDYTSILEELATVGHATAWGGEEEYPQELGHINVCMTPTEPDRTMLSSAELDGVLEELNSRKVLSTKRNVVQPQYITTDIDIQFIGQLSNNDIATKQMAITKIVNNYFNNELKGFGANFFSTVLNRKISEVFVNEETASVIVTIKPKLLLNPLIASYSRTGESIIRTYIPNTPKRYKLVHPNDPSNTVLAPESNRNLSDLLNNGWKLYHASDTSLDVSFGGVVNGEPISSVAISSANMGAEGGALFVMGYYATPSGDVPTPNAALLDKSIFVDIAGVKTKVGTYNNIISCISFDKAMLAHLIGIDASTPKYINLTYSPHFNVIGINNSIFRLGNIQYT